MDWLAEHPFYILLLGSLTTIVLLVGWRKTDRRELAVAAGLCALVTACLAFWSHRTVTPREAIRSTIAGISTALEANDLPAVTEYLASDAGQLRGDAEHYMGLVRVREATVKPGMKIELTGADRSEATATFPALLVVDDLRGGSGQQRIPSRFVLRFRREGSAWKVHAYERHEIVGAIK
ncbi:MAG: hypothetical protein U0795_12295 [Pirellulales bacterium]